MAESRTSPIQESPIFVHDEEEADVTFKDVLSRIDIKTQVENVIYTLNIQYSELRTIVEAHTGFVKALKTKNEAFRVTETKYLSEEEEGQLEEYEKLKEELGQIVDISDLSERFERFQELTRKIVNSEDKIAELHVNLDGLSKKSREWIQDVHNSGPAICEELMSVAVAVKESKKQYTFSIECLQRSLLDEMLQFLVDHFQKERVKLLLRHREEIDAEHAQQYRRQEELCMEWMERQKEGDVKCEALSCELAALCLKRKRQPRENKYDEEEKQRQLTNQRKQIEELRKHRNAAKYSRQVALKTAERIEGELRNDRSDLCIDVALHQAALCKSLKKAHLCGAKVDDFTHSHEFTCSDIVLG